jgi:hypothetical protein
MPNDYHFNTGNHLHWNADMKVTSNAKPDEEIPWLYFDDTNNRHADCANFKDVFAATVLQECSGRTELLDSASYFAGVQEIVGSLLSSFGGGV